MHRDAAAVARGQPLICIAAAAVSSEASKAYNADVQGAIFGAIGFGAGVIGTSLSNGLLALRKRLDKSFVSQNKPPDVVLNASTWALHMGISSNLRYQMLNGFDMVRLAGQPCLHV